MGSFVNRPPLKRASRLSNDSMEAFMDYQWPGNIRELKNAMEYSFVTSDGPSIKIEHLPKEISTSQKISPSPVLVLSEAKSLPDEKFQLIQALKQTKGNQTKAAQILNINRVTVWNRMKKYGIDLKRVMSV